MRSKKAKAMADWYVMLRQKETGPMTGEVLRQLAQSGTVGRDTPVRKGLEGRWVAAYHVKGLFDGVSSSSAAKAEPALTPQQQPVVIEQTAKVMGISKATVKREWMIAKAWLKQKM